MQSQHSGARPINPKPQTPEERCLGDVYAKIKLIVTNVETRLTKELNRPDLTLAIGGRPVENNGVVAQGFENITGLTQPSLTPAEREIRLTALIDEKTRQLLVSPPAITSDYQAYIQSFGVSIAHKPGDPGFSPAEMKTQSQQHLRDRISEAVAELTRQKFEQLAVSHILTPPPPPGPDLNPLLNIQQRILDSQEATRAQQAEQNRLQQEQQAKKTPDQTKAEEVRHDIREVLKPNQKLSHQQIYKWIQQGIDLAADKDRFVERLKNTGLIKYTNRPQIDPDTGNKTDCFDVYAGEIKSDYFKVRRMISFASWGATLAGTTSLLMIGASAGAAGLAAGLGMVCAVNLLNMGVQSVIKKLHTDTFTKTWKEIQSELDTSDLRRVPALTGLMYLLVDKYSPVILMKNQTKLWQFGQPMSTEAVLDHLKEASSAALNNIAGTTGEYTKVTDVQKKIQLAKTGLDNLEKRWNWHWGASTWWGSTLASTSFLGSLALGATAFL